MTSSTRTRRWVAVAAALAASAAVLTANGALVQLWTCHGGSNQRWTLG